MEVQVNITDTLFITISKDTVVASYTVDEDNVLINMASELYYIDKLNKTIHANKDINSSNIEAIHFTVRNQVNGELVEINDMYPRVVSKLLNKFNKPNTIYKVTKDLDLNHCVLTIPEGCTLLFDGGSFANGTIIVQNTKMTGSNFLDASINLIGKFDNDYIYFDWFINEKWDISDDRYKTFINGNNNSFGEAPEIPTTNVDIITKIISLGNIVFGKGIYPFSSEINLSSPTKFIFNGVGSQDTLLWFPLSNAINNATSYGSHFCGIYNLSIEADGNVVRLQSPFKGMHGFRTDNCTFISYNDNAFHQDRSAGTVSATMYGAKFTNLQVYAGRNKSAFYNIASNSNVYINVVDALYYFDRQSSVGRKGIMKALLENSSCLEFSNSNILYAGMKYVAYIEATSNLALRFNNCVFEGSGNAMVGEDRKGFLNIIKYGGTVLSSLSYISFQSCVFVNNVYDKGVMIDAEGANTIIIEPENTTSLTMADVTSLDNKSDVSIYAYSKKIDAGGTKRRLVLQSKGSTKHDLYSYSRETALSMGFSESFIDNAPDEYNYIAVYRLAEKETQLMLPPSYALPKGDNVLAWERDTFLTYKKGTKTWLLNSLPSTNTFLINSYDDYSYHYSQNHQGRYIIVGNIDLGGNSVNIRPNSTLDFQGGSFSNGTIVGSNTSIEANGNVRIFENIVIGGSISNDRIYITWFNVAKGTDDTEEFRRAFKTVLGNKGLTITIDGNALYRLSDTVEVYSTTKVELTKGSTLLNIDNLGFEFGSTTKGVYKYNGYHDIVFYGGGTIDLSANPSGLNKGVNSAFRMYHARNILIEGITIMNSGNYHMIEIGGCQNVTLRNMKFIGFFNFDDLPTYKGECIQIEMARSGNCSDMPYFDRTSCDNITVEGCYFGPQISFNSNGVQSPYGLIARGIGCHSELNLEEGDSLHTNINIVDNTFDRVYQACVSPRIMDKCIIKGNRALNLQGYFISTFNSHSSSFTDQYYLPSQNLVIDSNYIEQEEGIQTVQSPSCMASDYFNVYSLIGLENTVNVTIINNIFKNAQFYHIRCYNTQNTNINNNTFINWAGLARADVDYVIGFVDNPTSMMYPKPFSNVKIFDNVFINSNATEHLLSLAMNRVDVSIYGNTIRMTSQNPTSFKNINNRVAFPLYENTTYTDDNSEEGAIGTITLSDYPYNYSEIQVFYTISGYTNMFYSVYFNPIRNEFDGTNSDIMCAVMDTNSNNSLMLKQLHATLSNNNKNIVIDYNRIITHTIPSTGTPTATRQIAATGTIAGVGYIKIVKVLGVVANNAMLNH